MEHLHRIKKYMLFVSIFCCLALQVGCMTNRASNKIEVDDNQKYTVYKIDSVNNYYLVYLSFERKNYKVVSKKEKVTICKKIKVGDKYNLFSLDRIINPEDYIPKNVATGSPLEFVPDCIKFDEQTEICRERGMDNIYKSDNLKGLCYIENR
ncbi:hypothetical protein [Chryseobacterium lacus]|uniref:hypothetical protein n=1 Tax=Chryseobacterium lacus TaxID=2058346 RepID=UPI000F86E94B|nr:hypothetical protein [Chryseobacterium lacus]RST27709.1 hypothetical protein EIZ46_05225 [Chryseobacterium lacus]